MPCEVLSELWKLLGRPRLVMHSLYGKIRRFEILKARGWDVRRSLTKVSWKDEVILLVRREIFEGADSLRWAGRFLPRDGCPQLPHRAVHLFALPIDPRLKHPLFQPPHNHQLICGICQTKMQTGPKTRIDPELLFEHADRRHRRCRPSSSEAFCCFESLRETTMNTSSLFCACSAITRAVCDLIASIFNSRRCT
ncbi:uncharacterized protein PV09_06600 [Verruconis gallopava]|uniref:Uncharacterized protein n=1 Tax=Verruconis gallopava TaxID=253628 RepID=A0A0D2ASG5_9PEZI|nr:uncharacterized protein PV09_06600 [Verruconis gallopava]KIW02109.1 hypothetical protein PV09_06600 [Verruconis gallopava]